MTTETNGQQGQKSFLVSLTGNLTAEEVKAELDAWLNERQQAKEEAPPMQTEVKQVLDLDYISQNEGEKAIELLNAYVDTALPYQDLCVCFTTWQLIMEIQPVITSAMAFETGRRTSKV